MIFRQAAVAELNRRSVTERSPTLPWDVSPALLGSGEIALGFDATGLQGLNAAMRQFREGASLTHPIALNAECLGIHRAEALSRHYGLASVKAPEFKGQGFNHLPCGWLDYTLTIDDRALTNADLCRMARQWSREFSPYTGLLVTRFLLGATAIEWTAGIAPDAVEVDLRFRFGFTDGVARRVVLELRCHQTTRGGRPLALGGVTDEAAAEWVYRRWDASSRTSACELLEPIRLSWMLACDRPAGYRAEPLHLAARLAWEGREGAAGVRVVAGSDRNGSEGLAYARGRAEAFRREGVDAALRGSAEAWERIAAQTAEVRLGDPAREYLARMCQYTVRAGGVWRSGLPLPMLWSQSHGACAFWDSYSACEGMLRAGHVDQVRLVCEWLVKTAQPTGRPHYWMTLYNGQPDSTHDPAYQSCLAFAGICIRLYETTRDGDDLRRRVYPYLRRVAEFLFDGVLVRAGEGWTLAGETAGDIDIGSQPAARERGILGWAVVCVAKFAAYAERLGVRDALTEQARAVDAWFRAHPLDWYKPGMWGLWLPFLTEATPFVDAASWRRTARENLAARRMNFYAGQPWDNCCESASLALYGLRDAAFEMQAAALNFVGGLGYFYEGPPESHVGGAVPYLPTEGSYLSSLLVWFAHGSIWDDTVGVLTQAPSRLLYQRLSWNRVRTFNGAVCGGVYDPYRLEATVRTDRPRPVALRMPARIAGEPLLCRLDGLATPGVEDRAAETVAVTVPAGEHTLSLERDLERRADVLWVEPLDYGRELLEALEGEGLSVRWLRDFATLEAVAGLARVILVNVSYVALPQWIPPLLERLARAGQTVAAFFHGGCANVDGLMAALTGLNGTIRGGYWHQEETLRTVRLTDSGRRLWPELPAEFQAPLHQAFDAHAAADVEILAVETDRDAVAATRRRMGEGWVYWLAPGCKSADNRNLYPNISEMQVFGDHADARFDRRWVKDANWRRWVAALCRGGR